MSQCSTPCTNNKTASPFILTSILIKETKQTKILLWLQQILCQIVCVSQLCSWFNEAVAGRYEFYFRLFSGHRFTFCCSIKLQGPYLLLNASSEDKHAESHFATYRDLHHPADSLQLPGRAGTPRCWCGQQNKPSAERFDGPEIIAMWGLVCLFVRFVLF